METGDTTAARTGALVDTPWYRRPGLLGVALLLVALAATAVAVRSAADHVRDDADLAFRSDAEAARSSVEDRLAIYEETLRGLRALFAASKDVSRDEFNAYLEIEDIIGRFPGIQALEFTRRVAIDDVAAYEDAVRADRSITEAGYPDFAIHPVVDANDMLLDVLNADREIEIEVYDVGLTSGVPIADRSTDRLLYDSDVSSHESGELPPG